LVQLESGCWESNEWRICYFNGLFFIGIKEFELLTSEEYAISIPHWCN